MKKMRMLSILFSLLFAFLVVPNVCLAATTERTTTLDLSSLDLTINQENVDEGWSFNASEKTLTLKDINFNVPSNNIGIYIPANMDLKINLIGENKITAGIAIAQLSSSSNSGVVTITGSGSLKLTSLAESSALTVDNLIIESGKISTNAELYCYTLKIIDGDINIDTTSNSDSGNHNGFYVRKSMEILNGNIDIKTKETGILVNEAPLTETVPGIKITGGKINIDVKSYGIRYDTSNIAPGGAIDGKDILLDGANIDFKNTIDCIFSDEGKIIIKNSVIKTLDRANIYRFSVSNSVQQPELGDANYVELDSLLHSVPTDLTVYTDVTVNDLNAALTTAKTFNRENTNVLNQYEINQLVEKLDFALNNLQFKPSDFTNLDSMLLNVPSDLTIYVDTTLGDLNTVLAEINAYDRVNSNILNQVEIDALVIKLQSAISKLQLKPADYSKLQNLLDSITSNLSIYTDSTVASLKNVINSIAYDKNITEQNIVDEYTSNLKKALNNLVLKSADYSKIDELINSIDLSKYTDETVTNFKNFVNSIDRNINILNQEKVDTYIDEIKNIINSLVTKPIEKVDEPINDNNTIIIVPNNNHYTNNSSNNISDNTSTDEPKNDSKVEDKKDDNTKKDEMKNNDNQKDNNDKTPKTDKKDKKSNKVLLIILWIILGLIGLALVAFIILLIIKRQYTKKRRQQVLNRRTKVLKTSNETIKQAPKKSTTSTSTKTNNSTKKQNSSSNKNTTKKKTTTSKTTKTKK